MRNKLNYILMYASCCAVHTATAMEIIAGAPCGQNIEFLIDKPGDIYSNHWALGVYIFKHIVHTAQ
jgi:hypothetical protein